ncbi:Uncharacterized protein APZ42_005476, partial [Daphnia magna]
SRKRVLSLPPVAGDTMISFMIFFPVKENKKRVTASKTNS